MQINRGRLQPKHRCRLGVDSVEKAARDYRRIM